MLNLSANASNTTPLEDFDTLLSLTLLEQSNNVDFSDAASMTSLDYTGKKLYSSAMDQQTNQVTITNDLLTTLTIGNGYVGTLHVSGTGLTELTTAGKIVNFEVQGNAALANINFGHDHLSGERAATVLVANNSKITELNLSSIDKIKTVTVTGNASLTALTMAGYSPAAEPGAAINVTISGNALAATYTAAVAGSETTPYSDASLTDATGLLCDISDFINFYKDQTDRSATVSLSINLAKVTVGSAAAASLSTALDADDAAKKGIDGDASTTTDNETNGGAIDTIAELKAIVDTCS
jgi:hypothetical protein